MGTIILGAVEGDVEGAEVGSDVVGIAVIVGKVVTVGIALPVGAHVPVGVKDEVGTLEVEGYIVDDEGAKEVEGAGEELGKMLLPFAGASDGADDPSFKGEGATDI